MGTDRKVLGFQHEGEPVQRNLTLGLHPTLLHRGGAKAVEQLHHGLVDRLHPPGAIKVLANGCPGETDGGNHTSLRDLVLLRLVSSPGWYYTSAVLTAGFQQVTELLRLTLGTPATASGRTKL